MTLNGWLQILFFLGALFVVTPLVGGYMAKVFTRQRTWLDPVMRPLERLVYRTTGVNESHEMRWTEYAMGPSIRRCRSRPTLIGRPTAANRP
jgi:K+-transporting ATPase ATPase A chain